MNETAFEKYCYFALRGKVEILECDYPFIHYMEAALYRGVIGYLFTLIECGLLGLFWTANFFIEKDFTEAYLTVVALGIMLGTGLKIGCHAIDILYPREELFSSLLNIGYSTAAVSSQLTLIIGMPIYLIMALIMGTKRKQFYGICTWIPYLLIFVFSAGLSGCYFFIEEFISRGLIFIMLAPTALALLATYGLCGLNLLAFTCCSRSRRMMDRLDPVVFDARSRLAWAVLFVPLAHLTTAGPLYCLASLAIQIDLTDVTEVFENEQATRVWNFFYPIFFFLVAFAVLPSYRDKVMCGCTKQRFVNRVSLAPLPTLSALPTAPLYTVEEHAHAMKIQKDAISKSSIAPIA